MKPDNSQQAQGSTRERGGAGGDGRGGADGGRGWAGGGGRGWFTGRWMIAASFSPERYARLILSTSRVPFLQVVKTSAAAIVAWVLTAPLLEGQIPLFAVIAASLGGQPSENQSFGKALERCVGVIIGVILAYFVGLAFGDNSWVVLVAVIIALLLGWALRLGPTSSVQIPISAMLVLSLGATTPGYAFNRILETIVGALIGVAINLLIVPPVALQPVHEAVARLGNELGGILNALARILSTPTSENDRTTMLLEARLLTPMRAKAAAALAAGEESLKYNPRRSVHRDLLEADATLLTMLTILVTRVTGMARGVVDHYDDDLLTEPLVSEIVSEMRRASHDLRLVILSANLPGVAPAPAAPPAPGTPGLTGSLSASPAPGMPGAPGGPTAEVAAGPPDWPGALGAPDAPSSPGGLNRSGAAAGSGELGATPIPDDLPALTAPLLVAVPSSQHWVLLGFLLEDLRRIHEELVEATPPPPHPPRAPRLR